SITQAGSNNETVDLKQFGAGNLYTVTQKGSDNVITSLPSQGVQSLPSQGVQIKGPSYNATIKLLQHGDENFINGVKQVGNGNTFIVNQIGNENKVAMGIQYNPGTVYDGNFMQIDQFGDENKAGCKCGLYQVGENNNLTLTQNGGAVFGSIAVA